jgi:hypothetical protein
VNPKLVKLFFVLILAGGAGGVLGSMVGNAFGRGGLIAGGVLGGMILVAAAATLAARFGWIRRGARLWVALGGIAGFALACIVTLSTLSSPIGPALSTILIGMGGVLGELLGRSPHGQS